LRGHGRLQLRFSGRSFIDELSQNDVAHGKTDRRQRKRPVAEMVDQIIVASAPGERAQLSATIERFEDSARVIGKAAHDSEVNFDELGQAPSAKTIDQAV